MAPAPVIVTRPQRDAESWVARLRQAGIAAEALPLIRIAPTRDHAALAAARQRLAGGAYRAVMFVSSNAVDGFFKEKVAETQVLSEFIAIKKVFQSTRAWATGPGTAQALLRLSVPTSAIDAPGASSPQFDSETLWAMVGEGVAPGDRILIVRGADAQGRMAGRPWLAAQLAAAGAQVDCVAAYERHPPEFDAARSARVAQAAVDGSVWLFSSSEAIGYLAAAASGTAWTAGRAMATHPRIADAARQAGFGTVSTVPPAFDEIVEALWMALRHRC